MSGNLFPWVLNRFGGPCGAGCHIELDWLLTYKVIGDDLYLVRTGTDSDLF